MASPYLASESDVRDYHPSTTALDALLSLIALVIGLSPALDRFVPFEIGHLSPSFVIAAGFGTLGYWVGITESVFRSFMRWIVPFAFWAVLSLIAIGKVGTLRTSGGNLVWLLLIPGIAALCLDERRLKALLLGLILGSSVLLAVVAWRFVRGAEILDKGYLQFLGLNRNATDATIVWLVPFVVWAKTLTLPRIMRLLFVALAVIYLVSSQGRTGLIALFMTPVVYLLLKPASAVNRTLRFAMVAVLGSLLYVSLTTTVVPGLPATERIVRYRTADRSDADKIRLLLNKKSFALTHKHPFFGVGFGLYRGQYDAVIEEGENEHIREEALTLPAHDTYLEILATTGVPGFVFYVGSLLVVLVAGVRTSWDPDVRALTAGLVVVLFTITFHTSYGPTITVAASLVLAAVARARIRGNTPQLRPVAARPS